MLTWPMSKVCCPVYWPTCRSLEWLDLHGDEQSYNKECSWSRDFDTGACLRQGSNCLPTFHYILSSFSPLIIGLDITRLPLCYCYRWDWPLDTLQEEKNYGKWNKTIRKYGHSFAHLVQCVTLDEDINWGTHSWESTANHYCRYPSVLFGLWSHSKSHFVCFEPRTTNCPNLGLFQPWVAVVCFSCVASSTVNTSTATITDVSFLVYCVCFNAQVPLKHFLTFWLGSRPVDSMQAAVELSQHGPSCFCSQHWSIFIAW